jgi:lysophospholipase L1-like esterase
MSRSRVWAFRLVAVLLSVLLTAGAMELVLRHVYDPLGWLSQENWEEELFTRTYRVRHGDWADVNPDPDVKYLWGGSRANIPLPYRTYRRYLQELYQPSDNPIMGFTHRPGVRVTFRTAAGDYEDMTVEINARGLRDRDFAQPKPPRTYRILFSGDSVVFGAGVEAADTVVKALEDRLNRRARPGWRFEVVNYGVGGYNTRQELEFLKETRAMQDEPDLVLLGVVMNDHSETNSMLSWQGDLARLGDRAAAGATLTDEPTAKLLGRYVGARLRVGRLGFAGVQLVRKGVERLAEAWRGENSWRVALRGGGRGLDPATQQRIAASLAAFREYVRSHGVPLGLVVFPFEFALDPAHPKYAETDGEYRTWLQLARGTDLPTLDLLAAFLARRAEFTPGSIAKGLYAPWDPVHLNPRGHAMAADAVADFVSRHWRLPLDERAR